MNSLALKLTLSSSCNAIVHFMISIVFALQTMISSSFILNLVCQSDSPGQSVEMKIKIASATTYVLSIRCRGVEFKPLPEGGSRLCKSSQDLYTMRR